MNLLLWFIIAAAFSVESWRMGIGTFQVPGPGFLTFGVSLILMVLVIVLWMKERQKKIPRNALSRLREIKIKNIILGFFAIFVYAFLLGKLGYFLCTFFFLCFCLKIIAGKKWIVAYGVSMGMAAIAYFLFEKWLSIQFPKGEWVSGVPFLSWL